VAGFFALAGDRALLGDMILNGLGEGLFVTILTVRGHEPPVLRENNRCLFNIFKGCVETVITLKRSVVVKADITLFFRVITILTRPRGNRGWVGGTHLIFIDLWRRNIKCHTLCMPVASAIIL
jgi:hypothetical protein